MSPDDALMLYDDSVAKIGIEAQRRQHFKDFWATPGFSHLYLTDSDALHDPSWRKVALDFQARFAAPICLYNTTAHSRIAGNTIYDNEKFPVIWRHLAPGISYLLTREQVGRIMPYVDRLKHWDFDVPKLVGPMAISRTSYVEHVGQGGLHHHLHQGEGDIALNPTPFLVAKRKEVMGCLNSVAQPNH